jgi:hypothetical protein
MGGRLSISMVGAEEGKLGNTAEFRAFDKNSLLEKFLNYLP